MSLGAMKQFKQATGKDLWFSLLQFLEVFYESTESKSTTLTLCRRLYEVLDFETASLVFHSLINASGQKIPLIEIEDAMFRSGWLPTTREGEACEPWPLVMVSVAQECDKQLRDVEPKKPCQSTKPVSEES